MRGFEEFIACLADRPLGGEDCEEGDEEHGYYSKDNVLLSHEDLVDMRLRLIEFPFDKSPG